jgi:DNA polymerase III delta prime subunit
MIENTLWVEKYRPATLESYITTSELKSVFQKYLDSNDIPHLLLHGSAGGGKTTLAKIISNTIADGNYLYINASDENSVDTVRDKIKQFASGIGFGGLKIVILDEADFTTPNFQAALRNVMESFSKNTRFILTCNYVDKIIDPIQSRCTLFKIEPPSKASIAMMSANILDQESISYDKKDLAILINKTFPDARKTINELQRASQFGKFDVSELQSTPTVNNIILEILASKESAENKLKSIRQLMTDNSVRDYNSIFRFLYENVSKFKGKEASLILIIADAQYKDAFVIDHEINAMSMFIQIINELQ